MTDKQKTDAMLLGIGLDGRDGHTRITQGENFRLFGGSEDTHQRMQEVAVKINEKLTDRGKRLGDVSRQEFLDIARDVGLRSAAEE